MLKLMAIAISSFCQLLIGAGSRQTEVAVSR